MLAMQFMKKAMFEPGTNYHADHVICGIIVNIKLSHTEQHKTFANMRVKIQMYCSNHVTRQINWSTEQTIQYMFFFISMKFISMAKIEFEKKISMD